MDKKGFFIAFEGIEGSGKTTQAKLLAERLAKEGFKVLLTYEPGDTALGKRLREILLDPEINTNPMAELLLYFADRVQHVEEKIKPHLASGFVVITDRFTDSTLAYQGYGRGISVELIRKLNKLFLDEFMPDLTVLLDLPEEIGLKRNEKAEKKDRFELENFSFHSKVREGFITLYKAQPERFILLDATQSIAEIHESIYNHIKPLIDKQTCG